MTGSARGKMAALALGVACIGIGSAWLPWWPAAAADQGRSAYDHLAGMPVALLALLGLVPTTVLVALRQGSQACALATGLLAGAAGFFLVIRTVLHLPGPGALIIHGLIILAALAVARWPVTPVTLMIGALGLHGAFHHQVLRDVPLPSAVGTVAVAATAPVLPGRCRGPLEAPWQADLVLDMRCSHCAALRLPVLEALRGARITERLVARPSDPLGRDLARWGLAAAQEGQGSWDRYLLRMLGLPQDATRDEALAQGGALVARLNAVVLPDEALSREAAEIQALGFTGQTPLLVLRHRGTDAVYRWSGNLDLDDIRTRLARPPAPE